MKNIDLIFGYLINSPNGVSSVVRLLMENSRIFHDYNINCCFHVRGKVTAENTPASDTVSSGKSFKTALKNSAKLIISNSTKIIPHLHSAYNIFNILMLPGKRISRRYTAQESPDCKDPLFFNDIFSCYYYLKYTKSKNRPILLVIHSNGETYNMLRLSFPDIDGSWVMKKLNEIEKFTFSKVTDFGFVAKNALEYFKSLHPELSDKRFHYVHNGLPMLDYPILTPPHSHDGRFELCCVGSLSFRKGQDIILTALSKMSKPKRDLIHVTFLGDGNIRKDLEDDCKKYGITENVTFAGNRTDVNDFLLKSDIFILTSRDEGFPMAILEAERVGLPVISTRVAGIPEMIVNHETGLLIEPRYEDLLPIFENINSYDWKAMGVKSKRLFDEKFTIRKMIEGYSSIFKEM